MPWLDLKGVTVRFTFAVLDRILSLFQRPNDKMLGQYREVTNHLSRQLGKIFHFFSLVGGKFIPKLPVLF